MTEDFWMILMFWSLVFGCVTVAIGQRKNFPTLESFMWGAILGLIGVIVVVARKPQLPKSPPGMRAVKCPRCNAVGNVPKEQPKYECWQCKAPYKVA